MEGSVTGEVRDEKECTCAACSIRRIEHTASRSLYLRSFLNKCNEISRADILIYNSTVVGEISSVRELTDKYPMMKDFKAVKNGDVWCTERNMFQQTTGAADMISELHSIFVGDAADKMDFMYRLEE